ncbi:acyl-CoA dehydrogenase [Aquabacterium fontiphilum]|uniref:acyl-CoA dehydrogenase family protein n=1 Tax=Aquabacterium fontiphilum TaxID=450365 RepID=UPI0013772BC5|nr:acyl-CoA dehydrogenase family protein [Aquabacterium fontiphilum]NBD21692.1 acyl-CoA dehydrogenase [Aquabacterium fontiphilum]
MHDACEPLAQTVREIARTVAAATADAVDTEARFPQETFAALRAARVLSAGVPVEWGGAGLNLRQQAELCAELGAACGASGMVLAMHFNQLACLVRHAQGSVFAGRFLQEVAANEWLLASMTSEEGTFGDTRSSICAVTIAGERFALDKHATTGSYCAHADAILVTCRRHPDAAANDQALVVVRRSDAQLEQEGDWDTLGMRGTCSPGFVLRSQGAAEQVLPVPFADIAAESMVPYSHVLWAALWWGIARGAVSRAATFVRAAARKQPGVQLPSARRLAEVLVTQEALAAHWRSVADEVDALEAQPEGRQALHGMRWALRFNNLKIGASTQAQAIVHDAVQIVGIAGYKNRSPYSLGRHYRDVLSASMMIANERILGKNADMLAVLKEL